MNPFRTMLDRGIVVGAGLRLARHPARTRGSRSPRWSGTTLPASDCRAIEAIRIHTVGSARLAHQEEKKGSLEPGMHADFCAYDVDPLEAADVEGLRPILTVSLGREVFAA